MKKGLTCLQLGALIVVFIATPLVAKDRITIWTSSENVKNAIVEASKDFVKEYEIDVSVSILNKDLTTQFKTAALAGKGPDIFTWAHDVVGELADSGLIEPVQPSKSLRQAFLPVALKAFTYKGKVYGYPYDLEAIALIYNKKLIKKAPRTMADLFVKAKALNSKKLGRYGFLYETSNFFFSFPFLSAGGGYVFKVEKGTTNVNDIGLDNKGALAGVRLLRRFIQEGLIPASTDHTIASTKMNGGHLAMTIDGPWALADLKRSGISYGVAPIPMLAGKKARPFVGSHGFLINRQSKNKDAAKELIENYLVSKKGIMTMYKKDPRGPSRRDVLASLQNDVDLQGFMRSAEQGVPMPNVPQMGAVWSAVGEALQNVTKGRIKPDAAMRIAAQKIREALKRK